VTIAVETGYAKINLALHVRRRRDDGYHELETLFAFLDDGDRIEMRQAPAFHLQAHAPFGKAMGPVEDNLITRAARLAHDGVLPPLRFKIAKTLPVAAGLGGGSADAAAALRLMGARHRFDLAAILGADVPACLDSVPVIGRGTGTELLPVQNDVRGLACIIVNPNIPLATGPVFKAWAGHDLGPMPEGSAREIMLAGRNDLEEPAIGLCPAISEVLNYLRKTRPVVARMSGSGASCFAIYEDFDEAVSITTRLRKYDRPDWWAMCGRLR
jgi:4-diphosphocytidyl-2-C-methyl-D-erythritol kinase